MAENENQSTSSSRWWEFYAVRYGTGTVIGAIVFFFLCLTNPALKPLLFGADSWKIDGTQFALLGAYGLAYCYISSAPVLVFHAGRFLLQLKETVHGTAFRMLMVLWLPILLAMIAADHVGTTVSAQKLFYAAVAFVLTFIIWLQVIIVVLALWRSADLYDFYVRLDARRMNSRGSLIESYRHLREHGNSFFIVLLEIVLALALYAAGNHEFVMTGKELSKEAYAIPYVVIILVWTFPAVVVWFIGTVIERRFCEDKF